MKRIDLGKGYVIDLDGMNRTLKKDVRINTREKVEVLENGETKKSLIEYEASSLIGYYQTLETVMMAYYEQKVIDALEDKQTLKMAIKIMEEVKEEVKQQFDGIDLR